MYNSNMQQQLVTDPNNLTKQTMQLPVHPQSDPYASQVRQIYPQSQMNDSSHQVPVYNQQYSSQYPAQNNVQVCDFKYLLKDSL